jgi:hypothetical protein
MNKEEMKLFKSRNPREYINNSLSSRLPSGRKAYITRMWLEKTRFSIDDIQYARNRHPYWKSRKMSGSEERNQQRFLEHNYTRGDALVWNEKTIMKFIGMNRKDKSGRYIYKDHELAKHFRTTIPSIQHYRRKYNMAMGILTRKKIPITARKIYELIGMSEKLLRENIK